MKCETCGGPMPPRRGGRPRQFCSVACRDLPSRLSQVSGLLDEVRGRMSQREVRRFRSELWSIANQLNDAGGGRDGS